MFMKFLITTFLLISFNAHAYLGPGSGIGAILAALGIVFGFVILIFGIFWYPFKKLIKKIIKK